jgi:hypothetical protein
VGAQVLLSRSWCASPTSPKGSLSIACPLILSEPLAGLGLPDLGWLSPGLRVRRFGGACCARARALSSPAGSQYEGDMGWAFRGG